MPVDELDKLYLERAIELADRGRGRTSPNPMVGAVVVREGSIIAEGYHAGPGLDHAEVAALKQVPEARGATMYVTLEPCCNYGRTPPCTKALIEAGIGRVVVGAMDPSAQVNGRGVDDLTRAGIVVDVAEGELALRCTRQNNAFRKAAVTGLPFVTYKYAMTLDGRVACDSGDSRWVSGPESREEVHRLRAEVDAVVVGAGTLRTDDPLLTAREVACARQPLRVVVDSDLRLTEAAALVRSKDEGPVLVVCADSVPEPRRAEVESWGVETAGLPLDAPGRVSARSTAALLGARDVQSVLLEGGPTLAGSWWSAGLVDQVMAFVTPRVVSGMTPRSPLMGEGVVEMACATPLHEVETRSLGRDVCICGYATETY